MSEMITPAMKDWCRRILNRNGCALVKSKDTSIDAQCIGSLSHAAPSYIMVGKLEDAGLIEWKPRVEYAGVIASLTERGMLVAQGVKL